MDWKKEFETGQQLVRDRKYEEAVTHYKTMIENSEEEHSVYYWALKHFADIVGPLHYKDHFRAIDIYQKIINEYEGEDGLYEWCQVDMAKTYLQCGMDMIENYDNLADMLTPLDDNMAEYIEKMNETREDFITQRAEVIYKSRM